VRITVAAQLDAEIASPLTRGPERSPESRFAMPRWWMVQSAAN
jgi:hypothetical protein